VARIVFLPAQQRYTGGVAEIRVDAADFRAAAAEIARRFPGFPAEELRRCTVAIDGELVSAPYLEPLGECSEVLFIGRLAAG
jgi:hypothetical protein